jgi:L-ascorbate metabolism protein UlaG (beta-lactamase superfamily)
MSITVTWLGHGSFSLDIDGTPVLIDPFLTDNPVATARADELSADYILISHGHFDHTADAAVIAKRTGATCISNYEISQWLMGQGVEEGKVHGQHIGGGFHHPFGYVKLTIAHHGSRLPDGNDGGNPCGFLITAGNKKLYFACDTGLFESMRLYGEEGIDFAALPIGDNFTMGPDDALRAVKLLQPKVVVPAHYNTWPLIEQDADAWAKRVEKDTKAKCAVLKPGESHTL